MSTADALMYIEQRMRVSLLSELCLLKLCLLKGTNSFTVVKSVHVLELRVLYIQGAKALLCILGLHALRQILITVGHKGVQIWYKHGKVTDGTDRCSRQVMHCDGTDSGSPASFVNHCTCILGM